MMNWYWRLVCNWRFRRGLRPVFDGHHVVVRGWEPAGMSIEHIVSVTSLVEVLTGARHGNEPRKFDRCLCVQTYKTMATGCHWVTRESYAMNYKALPEDKR